MSESKKVKLYFDLTEEEAELLQKAIDDGELKQFGVTSLQKVGPSKEIPLEEWQQRINAEGKGKISPREPL